jgi:hypothetical protein
MFLSLGRFKEIDTSLAGKCCATDLRECSVEYNRDRIKDKG